jgi:hypothetical protein
MNGKQAAKIPSDVTNANEYWSCVFTTIAGSQLCYSEMSETPLSFRTTLLM